VVHYFEGDVRIAGQPLEARLGKFDSIPDGGELRTVQGRAEVLLTPGVFLRVGENSAVRLVNSELSDTRVELLAGSAIVDSQDIAAGTAVTLLYKGWSISQKEKGSYRVDCDPPGLRVREGEVEASEASSKTPVMVAKGMELPFTSSPAVADEMGVAPDALGDWSAGRDEAISADNAIAENIQDPASMTGLDYPLDGFTYFPMLPYHTQLGLGSAYGLGAYPYGAAGIPAGQLGFYSVYLPGYTRRPLGVSLPGRLPRTIYPPGRIGYPAPIGGRLPTARPVTPGPRAPMTHAPATHAPAVHIGRH
jgi:hypothetical protein